MSESLMGFAEALYQSRNPLTGEIERVQFDQTFGGVTYGRTQDGYFVVQTGNSVADAVVSVFLNEVGIDNFANAVSAARGGRYGEAAKQSLYGVTQAALALIPGVNVVAAKTRGAMLAARAAGGIGRALGSRILSVPAGARYALNRAFQQPTFTQGVRTLIPRYGSTARQLRIARRQGLEITPQGFVGQADIPTGFGSPAILDPPAPVGQLAFPETIATRGVVPAPNLRGSALERGARVRQTVRQNIRANANAPGAPPGWTQRARYLVGRDPIPGTVAGTGFGRSPVMSTFTRFGVPALTATWAIDAQGNRAVAAEQAQAAQVSIEAEAANSLRAASAEEQMAAAEAAINERFTGTTANNEPSPEEDIRTSAQASFGAIDSQYNRAVNELRSMYQLSETDDERERIKFILADIQAQAQAGRAAIQNVFERKQEEVSRLTDASREAAIKSAERASDLYMLSSAQLQDQLNAGYAATARDTYGFGAAVPRDESEYVALLASMAPVTAEYRQAIGDINTQGLEWMEQIMGEQTAARQADLARLALSTSAAATAEHKAAVDRRINAERLALASSIQSLREQQMSQAGATQRALIGQSDTTQTYSPLEIEDYLVSQTLRGGSIENILAEYAINFAGKPNPLGGVYPTQIPQVLRQKIVEARAKYEAALALEEAEFGLAQQEMAEAQGAYSGGIVGAE